MKARTETRTKQWMVDGTVAVEAICEEEDWHLATVIRRLQAAGLSRDDAEVFAQFVFDDHSTTGLRPEDELTEEQWARLSL